MKALLFTLFVSSVASAQSLQADIKNFNFNYRAPQGEGTAETFSYGQKVLGAQKVLVNKNGDDFDIQLEGVENREYTFKNAPSLIKDANKINLSAFNLSFQDKASLSMASGTFESPEKTLKLKNLTLNCDRISTFPEVMDQVIGGCIQKMSFKAASFSQDKMQGIEEALMKALDESYDDKASLGVNSVDLKITGGKLELSAEIKAQISGKAKASGTVKYEAPAKKLTVKISEVKFGILDVTSKVFDELKKQESETIKVKEPYVYITIK